MSIQKNLIQKMHIIKAGGCTLAPGFLHNRPPLHFRPPFSLIMPATHNSTPKASVLKNFSVSPAMDCAIFPPFFPIRTPCSPQVHASSRHRLSGTGYRSALIFSPANKKRQLFAAALIHINYTKSEHRAFAPLTALLLAILFYTPSQDHCDISSAWSFLRQPLNSHRL